MGQMARTIRLAGVLMMALGLAACSSVYRTHGYVPADDELAALNVGTDTRETVAAAVGRPTSTGVLDVGGWYYVKSRFRHFGARAPEEIDREVLAISFDDTGTVQNIERFGLEDGRVVALSRRVTETNIRGIGFLEQLFGNLGNFDAGNFLD